MEFPRQEQRLHSQTPRTHSQETRGSPGEGKRLEGGVTRAVEGHGERRAGGAVRGGGGRGGEASGHAQRLSTQGAPDPQGGRQLR